MIISLRLNEQENDLFRKYAELHNISLSDLIRESVMEKIEDEYDLKLYEETIAEFRENPVIYTHDEVKKILELN